MSLAIEVVHQSTRFENLRTEWSSLLRESTSDSVFLTWEWLHSWWTHLRSKGRLYIVLVWSDETLVAIAPLMATRRPVMEMHPFPVLEFMGSGVAGSDYLDFIVRRNWEEPVFQALRRFFVETRLTLQLERLRRHSSRVQDFTIVLASHAWTIREENLWICPYIDISGHSWQSYLSGLGSMHRYNFNRRLKGLSKNFELRFECATTESTRANFLADLISLHRDRRSRLGGSNAFENAALVAFHETFSRLAFEQGWLRLFVMSLDGHASAALYGFSYNQKFYFYQSGFDGAYSKHSVGLVTMGLAIRSAIEEGLGEYDMLEGAEPYKSHWAPNVRELTQITAYPPGMTGSALNRMSEFRAAARKAVRRTLALSRH
ncbi:MAG TPA: GNAT family N-acetyltransferase [Terriglobia bacterium]|nr:GNAT family N-acetyltransferase [Terriglobia bacterium]